MHLQMIDGDCRSPDVMRGGPTLFVFAFSFSLDSLESKLNRSFRQQKATEGCRCEWEGGENFFIATQKQDLKNGNEIVRMRTFMDERARSFGIKRPKKEGTRTVNQLLRYIAK